MKFCAKCGKEIRDEAVICVHCGCAVTPPDAPSNTNDASNTGFFLLGFFLPLAGLILYLINKDTSPKKAKSAGKGALIGLIASVAASVLYLIFWMAIYGTIVGSILGSLM